MEDQSPRQPRCPVPDAVSLRHDFVPLLEGPVPPALGHIRLLEGFLQLLAQSLALLSKDFGLLVGPPSVHCHCVFDLMGMEGKQRGRLLGLLAQKCTVMNVMAEAELS